MPCLGMPSRWSWGAAQTLTHSPPPKKNPAVCQQEGRSGSAEASGEWRPRRAALGCRRLWGVAGVRRGHPRLTRLRCASARCQGTLEPGRGGAAAGEGLRLAGVLLQAEVPRAAGQVRVCVWGGTQALLVGGGPGGFWEPGGLLGKVALPLLGLGQGLPPPTAPPRICSGAFHRERGGRVLELTTLPSSCFLGQAFPILPPPPPLERGGPSLPPSLLIGLPPS